jgi:hypothetical protein
MNCNSLTKSKWKKRLPAHNLSMLLKKNMQIIFDRILFISIILIGNKRKNGNQHKMNIPTTIPNVFAEEKRKE